MMMSGSFVLDPNGPNVGEVEEIITTAAAAGVVRPRAAEEHDAKAKGSPSERRHRPRTATVSASSPARSEPTPTRADYQDQAPVQVHAPADELPNLPNAIPALHRNLDGAYERLSALLQRERRRANTNNSNGGGGVLECHLAKPRYLIRKRVGAAGAGGAAGGAAAGGKQYGVSTMMMTKGAANSHKMAVMEDADGGRGVRVAGAGGRGMAEGPAEGRQPADEFDLRQVRRGSDGNGTWNTSSTTTDGQGTGGNGYNHPETILRKLLLQLAPDEEVDEVPLSDVGLIYHHAGVDRNGVVGNVHRLATRVFGEGEEIVEIAMSYLDRYLMAKADPASLTHTVHHHHHHALLSGLSGIGGATATATATTTNPTLFRSAFSSPRWSIVCASLACLQIAIKTHSPHGDRLSHRPPHEFLSSEYCDALEKHKRDADPHVLDKWRGFNVIEARMVAELEQAMQGGSAREIRHVFVRTEADILHTLEFRLVPTTSWGVARDLMDIAESSVQIERLAYERFRQQQQQQQQQQAARMAEDVMQDDEDDIEEDKTHRLAGPPAAAATLPPPYPIHIDSPRLTKLTNCQLSAALYDHDLLPIPRSILARAAVQNALVQLNEESRAAHGLAGTFTQAEVQAQYEAGCAIVGRLAGALRGACSVPYGGDADMDWDSTDEEEEYEKESMFQFAVQSLGKHLSQILQQEAKKVAAQNGPAAQKEVHGTSHVVTPSGGSTADSALDFASEHHHRAKKARKVKKNGGIGRLLSGFSPGCGKSGRVILE